MSLANFLLVPVSVHFRVQKAHDCQDGNEDSPLDTFGLTLDKNLPNLLNFPTDLKLAHFYNLYILHNI